MASGSSTFDLPTPESDEKNLPFWDAAEHETLVLPRCIACGNLEAPPVSNCRRCLQDVFEWIPAAGTGTLYSFIEYHKAWTDAWKDHVPYVVAIINLDEGPRLLSGMVREPDGGLPVVGQRMAVWFQERAEGAKVPMFRGIA